MTSALAHRNAARWTVALAVGLRQSEAFGLRWADVYLDNATLTVQRGLHRVAGHGLVYEEPKAERSTAGPLRADQDLVFAQPNGKPIERNSDWRA